MANSTKLAAVLAMLVLLHVLCAVARRHVKPGPCGPGEDSLPGMCHKGPHCSSPAVPAHGTPAVMMVNGFQKGEDSGGPAACDGHYHTDHDMLVALSTGWYYGGRRCHKTIRITSAHNGRTVETKVVGKCDSRHSCRNNIVDTSAAVWKALGLHANIGEVPVTWSDA